MMRRTTVAVRLRSLAALLVIAGFGVLVQAEAASAQGYAQERSGFWGSGGLGYGSLGLDGFSGREAGLSGNLSLGGTISPRFLLGGGTTGWTKEVDGIRFSFSTLLLLTRFYPNQDGGFFLTAGLGAGSVSASEGSTSVSESGGGALLGLGYDVRVGPRWSLSPYVNAIGFDIDGDAADVFQFGLGVTFH